MRWKETLLFLGMTVLAACQMPQHMEPGVVLKRDAGQARILMLPPDIQLSELTAGGVLEPRADWTGEAMRYLSAGLKQEEAARQATLIDVDVSRIPADRREEFHQLMKLYGTVGEAIFNHQYRGALQLPTKKAGFHWSIGPSLRPLREEYGADYALLTFVRDSYSSGGRQALIVLGALAGIGVSGGVQVAFVSLVDLETGDILWFNRRISGRGDLRNPEGARDVARTLLASAPK